MKDEHQYRTKRGAGWIEHGERRVVLYGEEVEEDEVKAGKKNVVVVVVVQIQDLVYCRKMIEIVDVRDY